MNRKPMLTPLDGQVRLLVFDRYSKCREHIVEWCIAGKYRSSSSSSSRALCSSTEHCVVCTVRRFTFHINARCWNTRAWCLLLMTMYAIVRIHIYSCLTTINKTKSYGARQQCVTVAEKTIHTLEVLFILSRYPLWSRSLSITANCITMPAVLVEWVWRPIKHAAGWYAHSQSSIYTQ